MSTIKATNIQPQSDSDPLVFSTNATERMRIPSSGVVSITGGADVFGTLLTINGKATSTGTTGTDSATTLTTKSYVDAIYQPQVTNVSGSYARLGNLLIEFGYIPITSMILDTVNNHYGAISFPIPYTEGPWSIQVTPRFSAYNAGGDIVGQVASVSLTGFTAVLNGTSSGTLTNLIGYYWQAVGTA